MSCFIPLALSGALPFSYVGFLHLFDYNGTDRNEASSVRKRCAGALLCSLVAMSGTYFVLTAITQNPLFLMGLRTEAAVKAIALPGSLVLVLYAGQILMMYFDGHLGAYFDNKAWKRSFADVLWLRDIVVAPVTEELVFRSCSAALMAQCLSKWQTIWLAPLFFASSHFHHVFDDRRNGYTTLQALGRRGFQFLYTYLFGAYATYLFLSTRHVLAAVVTHCFCNSFGLPLFNEIGSFPHRWQRVSLWLTYGTGVVLFALLVPSLTDSRRFF